MDAPLGRGTELPVKVDPWHIFGTELSIQSLRSLNLITRERIKKYLLSYVIQLSKSYTILLHCQHFNFTTSLGPQLKPGGWTPEVKAGQQVWVTKLEKHQTFGKRIHGGRGALDNASYLQQSKLNSKLFFFFELQSREILKSLLRVRDGKWKVVHSFISVLFRKTIPTPGLQDRQANRCIWFPPSHHFQSVQLSK